MTRKMGIRWHLRELMASRGMFQTSELIAPLAERGVELSREQVYRLVTQQPERLNVYTLAALCDILDCEPSELIEPVIEQQQVRKRQAGRGKQGVAGLRPKRARVAERKRPGGETPTPRRLGAATPGCTTCPAHGTPRGAAPRAASSPPARRRSRRCFGSSRRSRGSGRRSRWSARPGGSSHSGGSPNISKLTQTRCARAAPTHPRGS
jgi:DNA-binding Xre family transcriptional regulator